MMDEELIPSAQARDMSTDQLMADAPTIGCHRHLLTGAALVEAGRRSPCKEIEIEPERFPISQIRDVDL